MGNGNRGKGTTVDVKVVLSKYANCCLNRGTVKGSSDCSHHLPLLPLVKARGNVSRLSLFITHKTPEGHNERDPFFIQQRRLRHRLRTIGLWQHTNVLLCHDWHKGQPHLRGRVRRCQHCPVIFWRSHHSRSQGMSEGLVARTTRGAFTLWFRVKEAYCNIDEATERSI